MAERFTQRDLTRLKWFESDFRAAADNAAALETESGDLELSPEAVTQLRAVPSIVRQKADQPPNSRSEPGEEARRHLEVLRIKALNGDPNAFRKFLRGKLLVASFRTASQVLGETNPVLIRLKSAVKTI